LKKLKDLSPEEMRQEMIKLLDVTLSRISYKEKRFLSTFIKVFQEWEEKRNKLD